MVGSCYDFMNNFGKKKHLYVAHAFQSLFFFFHNFCTPWDVVCWTLTAESIFNLKKV
jgi:hypothetical protein